MIKIKRGLSLLVSIFLILSNIVFAQQSNPSQYEGRPIDPAGEGTEYYREGNIIVYRNQIDSEKEMMGRFMKEDFSEEEMRRMAKDKFGEDFDEMEFKKEMMKFREREERKSAFSYENEGYGRNYYAPSYEGYSKEYMVFGMLFEYIGDEIDPREIKQNCNDPDKIAEQVIAKLKDKVGDYQEVCKKIDEQESKCLEYVKKECSQIGTAYTREGATELEKLNAVAYSCPVNKDAIVEACNKRGEFYMKQRIENLDEECKKRFDFEGERLVRECEKFRESRFCDEDRYMKNCMAGVKEDENEDKSGKGGGFISAKWECYDGSGESRSDGSCKSYSYWSESARKSCESRCNAETGKCRVLSFSVSNECRPESKQACPYSPVPQCERGAVLKSRTDSNGCVYSYCEKELTVCAKDAKQCPDGSYVSRTGANCEFAACPNVECVADADCKKGICPDGSEYRQYGCSSGKCITINYFQDPCQAKCSEPVTPACTAGTHLEKKADEKGCVTYYCKQDECPQASKPSCASGERLEAYYDNRGCVTSYQCIKYETACPAPTKPTCTEGQSMTTRYDDKGCIVGYECISVTSTTSITGNVAATAYNDFKMHCEKSWLEQQKLCLETPKVCDKEAFIEKCREQEKKSGQDLKSQIEKNCRTSTDSEVKHAEERCSKTGEEIKKCLEQGTKRCEHMKGLSEKCREFMTEDNIRKFIVEETKKKCKFKDILEDEDDIKKADKAEIVLAVLKTAAKEDIDKLSLFVSDLKEDLKLQDTIIYKGKISPNNFGEIKLLPFVINAKISAAESSERSKEVKSKIVASTKVEEAAGKLASLRDSDVPSEYLY
ncbi:hypothetical protein HY637_05365, partial [Candidatus Woesearchaeota archaeon]|nr:hypothetical protein [Candidatus Woesearchaeota archaeon]